MAGRGIKYTEQERVYALQYVDVLLERDHQMSPNMIAGKLSKKVRTHYNHCPWIPDQPL
jgi:hypothetical protein